jgi:hypothetical protein
MTTWNFCPWCGHRLYQHNGEGCTHKDWEKREGEGALQRQMVSVAVPCDCTRAHPFLVETAGWSSDG